jgi:hypothetical protein
MATRIGSPSSGRDQIGRSVGDYGASDFPMELKQFEIRDRATCVPALAIRISGDDGPIVRRAGFKSPMVLLIMLAHPKIEYDSFSWDNQRTMGNVHRYIEDHWDELIDGQVVDVRFFLGETARPAEAECI